MAGTFNDQTSLRAALYTLLANDGELFNQIMEAEVLASEWLGTSWSPAYVSPASFSLPVDLTADVYLPGRAVRLHLATGHIVAYVVSASFSPETGLTTVELDRQCLDSSLDEARVGVLSPGGAAPADLATRAWAEAQPRALPGLLPDDQLTAENDTSLGAVRFGNGGAVAWGHFAAWLGGVAWRIKLEAMLSTAEAANVGLTLVYQVFGPDVAMNPVKTRWQAGRAYSLGDKVVPASPNGSHYQCATAGTSGAAAPSWPASGTVSDGTVVWTRQGNGLIALGEYSLTPPAAAYDRFDIDSAGLQIPAGAVAAGDRVHFGLWRAAGDTHAGDLIVNELWIAPVEV